jgi:hypothetical protein
VEEAFWREMAHERLVHLAADEAPAYDPAAGPDLDGLWATWATDPGEAWRARIDGIEDAF